MESPVSWKPLESQANCTGWSPLSHKSLPPYKTPSAWSDPSAPCPCALSAKSCPTLCDPKDCSLPGFSVQRIVQARILGWVATSSSRRSSQLRDRTQISCTGRWILYHWATWEALHSLINSHKFSILSLTKVSHPQGLSDSKVFRK